MTAQSSAASRAARVIKGLKPGGVVIVEAGRAWFPRNGLLTMFEPLRVRRYEDEHAPSDFFGRSDMDVVRLMAETPVERATP